MKRLLALPIWAILIGLVVVSLLIILAFFGVIALAMVKGGRAIYRASKTTVQPA